MSAPTPEDTAFVEGVGGRLSAPKSDSYRRSVLAVEGRANRYVARHMLASDLAYVLSAVELGLTPREDGKILLRCLLALLDEVDTLVAGEPRLDIVVQRESWVLARVPKPVAARLHLGRNRGESVRGFLPRMFFRDALFRQGEALRRLLRALVTKAEPVLDAVIPLYHHLQHASYTTLGEYLLAWASNLHPYLERLEQADHRIDIAPPVQTFRENAIALGEAVQRRLNFSRIADLRQQLHVTEDQFTEPYFAMVMVAVALARLAEDLRLYMSSEFAFFDIDDTHASGSSVLPQKKNPFGLQAVIGSAKVAAARLSAQLSIAVSLCEELDSVFQAGSLYQQADDIVANTHFMAEVIERGRFDLDEMRRKSTLGFAGTSEALDILVFEADVPMRIAHHELGAAVRALVEGQPMPDLKARIEAETGRPLAVDIARVLRVLRGEEVPETALKLPTVHATWRRLSQALAALPPAVNPMESAISRLQAEARKVLA